eukprot:TRINITY_DN4553_c0_g4_i1.p2 TRINITY_DN4553_c0_g4~~TRINITY_DN4553_c0_g4_i1.p2  ORF type:complete len:165 (-),score=19.87 TRINITY_DN4553_c0_g4_i1:139-633(-)
MSNQKIVNEGGIIGTGEGLVNQNSKEFKELQKLIKTRSKELAESEIVANQLLSLRFQMESYLETGDPKEVIQAGEFLEEFVDAIKIKKKDFAEYIEYKESNLSAIFKGRRKINIDLAIKFGEIFRVDPVIWLHIQSKNELLEIIERDKERYEKYKLEDLLKEVD